jgi:putative transposase
MNRSRSSENQIIDIRSEAEAGVPLNDLCCTHGFSQSSFYKWKATYGGIETSDLRRLRDVEEENKRLKKM